VLTAIDLEEVESEASSVSKVSDLDYVDDEFDPNY